MALIKPKSKPAPTLSLAPPPAPVESKPVEVQFDATIIEKALQAQQVTLEQMNKANDAFIAALRHEFAKQNYKSITATVKRDKQGRIETIQMEVERT